MTTLVRIDPRLLQDEWDAEADRQRFDALRHVVRSRPAGEPHPLIGGALLMALAAIGTVLVVAIGGAA